MLKSPLDYFFLKSKDCVAFGLMFFSLVYVIRWLKTDVSAVRNTIRLLMWNHFVIRDFFFFLQFRVHTTKVLLYVNVISGILLSVDTDLN